MLPAAALIIGPLLSPEENLETLEPAIIVRKYLKGSRVDFLAKCASGEWDDVVGIFRSNLSSEVTTGQFTKEVIEALPKSVKYICHSGAGYDNIDVEACTARGIAVSNTPNINKYAVADLSIYLMIGALRRLHGPLTAIRLGQKQWRGANYGLGHDPRGKLLGIVGMGGIGSEVATRALAFGMRIQYHNRHQIKDSSYSYVTLEELIKTSDVISLNLAVTPETHHMLSAPQFSAMKPGVVIINTARGALIDEKALVKAIEDGKVYAAGLDVFEEEPTMNEELLKRDEVVLSPHLAAGTVETMESMDNLTLQNLSSGILEGKLITQVREQL